MISVPFILLGCVLVLLIIELLIVRKLVRKIPIRIHVNGSRGKSTVTRYIAAGLRSGEKRTLGKITGIIPTIFLPDQRSEVINRRGPANVREQFKMIRLAITLACDAIVLECMSIASGLQQIETKILQPHITVLTNILEDHLEELGSSDYERTEAYCSSLPSNALVVTNDTEHIFEIERAASSRNSRVILAGKESLNVVLPSLNPIALEHILLSLTVCKLVGVEEGTALQAILNEMQQEESLLYSLPKEDGTVKFVNGFAVNDVNSAKLFLETWNKRLGGVNNLVFIINTRADRPRRSVEFARWCASIENLHSVIITGTHIPFMRRILCRFGYKENNIYQWTTDDVLIIHENILNHVKGVRSAVFGFGNIAGDGFVMLDALKQYQERAGGVA